MVNADSWVTIHMAASLDGFIARKDGRVDWLETSDEFVGGEATDPGSVEAFLKTIDCYAMGSRTYEAALRFAAQGFGWPYGDKPTFILTRRDLPRIRGTVEFHSGDLARFVNERLRPAFRSIWFVGGGMVVSECLRLGLADEVRYSILPILIGDGIPFFNKLDKDIALHLAEVRAYRSGMVELRYEGIAASRGTPPDKSMPRAAPRASPGALNSIPAKAYRPGVLRLVHQALAEFAVSATRSFPGPVQSAGGSRLGPLGSALQSRVVFCESPKTYSRSAGERT